jgi:4-coumarate--CoA ligase
MGLAVIFVDIAARKNHTFRELRDTSEQIGRGLRYQWGWKKGDVMALFTPNSADIGAVTFGTHWAGGIVCPVNNLFTVGELASQLKSSGAKGLATHLANLEVAREAALIVGVPLDRIILIGDPDPKGRVKHISSLRNTTKLAEKVSINPKEDLAFLVYSSGTTALPKGVMLSHENIVANILQNSIPDEDKTNWRNDRMIGFLPMYHIYGKFDEQTLCLYLSLPVGN